MLLVLALVPNLFAATSKRKPKTKVTDATAEQAADEATPDQNDPTAPKLGPPQTIRFRVGAEITASRGACRGIVAMVTVPLDCPEQKVTVVEEDFSPEVAEVTYRPLVGGEVKQMLISVPRLNEGATAHAILTCDVTTRTILPPEKTDELKIPKKLTPKIKMFTNASPYIEVNHQKIHAFDKEISDTLEEKATDWEKIEAIYQGRSAVFIALCRANKIPARMVWVHGHCYPEFYLEHAEGEGYWYPCESAGTRAFGEMPLARTILQKGDNFRVPERKEKLRYASDFVVGLPTPGGGKPQVKYIREIAPQGVGGVPAAANVNQ